MPTVNYKHVKRQKELEKKKKRAEKDRRTAIKKGIKTEEKPASLPEK